MLIIMGMEGMKMERIMKHDDHLYIYSMGKRLKVTAIFTNEEEANGYMAVHDEQSVIASFEPFVFLANRFDKGE